MLEGSVVVEDDVDHAAGGQHVGLDGVEEADELLMAVTLHAAGPDGTLEHVEGGKQRGRAVALVVVGHGRTSAGLERQAGLGAVERPGPGPAGPVRRLARRLGAGQRQHLGGGLCGHRRLARPPRLVPQKPVHALLGKAPLPAPDGRLTSASRAAASAGRRSAEARTIRAR